MAQHRPLRLLAGLLGLISALLLGGVVSGGSAWSAAAGSASAGSTMTSTEASFAKSVLTLLNRQRAAHKLPALATNAALVRAGNSHNRAMAESDTATHQARGEASFDRRQRAAGWHDRCGQGENVGANADTSRDGAVELQKMMYAEKAPNDGHRRNILSRSYTHVGVAVLVDDTNGMLWLSVEFAKRC